MNDILIYVPNQTLVMSTALIKDLCWVAVQHNAKEKELSVENFQNVCLVSCDGKPVQCSSGNQLSVDLALDEVESAGAIFLSAFWGSPSTALKESQQLLEWLCRAHAKGIPIAGTSNGPFFMAEAGLLDGKVATVYPPMADVFQRHYPTVNLLPERAITDAGNLYCANGIASGCDLIVSIIEMLFGPSIARQISQDFLIGFNRSYTLANVTFDGQKYHHDGKVLTVQQWLERNYDQDVSLEVVAADVGMSPRNFSRRFKQATGDSPSLYLQRVRIEASKDLLRNTALSIAEVSYKVGYADESYFSRVFKRICGDLPHVFRGGLK